VIAQLAREAGALTVGVVTKPFVFEGRQRARRAEQGLIALTEHVDTLITIPNEKLMTLADADMTFVEAFRKADEVLFQAVKGISDLIMLDGIVNVDFADVRTVMAGMGRALMGTGCAKAKAGRVWQPSRRSARTARQHLGRGRDRRTDQRGRRPRHEDARNPGGGVAGSRASARRRQYHLRRQHRRVDVRHAQGNGDRYRLSPRRSRNPG